jgi:hypothetical protein
MCGVSEKRRRGSDAMPLLRVLKSGVPSYRRTAPRNGVTPSRRPRHRMALEFGLSRQDQAFRARKRRVSMSEENAVLTL